MTKRQTIHNTYNDTADRRIAMATTRDDTFDFASVTNSSILNPNSSLDVTRWRYDAATGLLTNKVYADGSCVRYTYTEGGRLATRVWSRGVTTSYAYDALGQLTNVHYSGNTPDVSFAYDRLGRVVSAITAVSSHLFEYAGLDLAGEIQDGVAITRSYDGLGRSTGFNMGDTYSAAYGYDTLGRFHSASSSVCSVCSLVNYSRLPGTDLVASMTNSAGFWWQRTYEQNRDLIAAVSNHVNHVNPVLISAYDYANDAAGRRVSRNADTFGYNARSEVIGAVIGTNDYGYAYDAIGNRVWSAVNTLTNSYTANGLNQYTAVTPPIAVAYDADGNMTYLGEWYHTWDAENRLTRSQPAGFATNGAIRLEYVYNHKNLRVAKIKKQLSGRSADYPFNPLQPGTWDAIETRRYVWDGYNIAAEIVIDEVAPSTNVTYYTWGLDLSGTLQGAGGVGGLLAVVRNGTPYFPCYDANGNITEYVDGSGNIRAHYEYSPFGEITAQSGDLADTFTHRFSTKPFDTETGLVMYQFRLYAPSFGRFPSKDPLGEPGGINGYAFVENSPVNLVDPLGLKPMWCGWLEGKIRSFLTSAEDIRAWDRFISGSKRDITLTDAEMGSIINSSSKFMTKKDERKRRCDVPSYPNWFAVVDTIGDTIGDPWSASIGGVSIEFKSTCACRCLMWSAKINDYYDFNPRWLKTHRSLEAELKTILVRLAQVGSGCGWKEFYHKGETFGSCGSGCKTSHTP